MQIKDFLYKLETFSKQQNDDDSLCSLLSDVAKLLDSYILKNCDQYDSCDVLATDLSQIVMHLLSIGIDPRRNESILQLSFKSIMLSTRLGLKDSKYKILCEEEIENFIIRVLHWNQTYLHDEILNLRCKLYALNTLLSLTQLPDFTSKDPSQILLLLKYYMTVGLPGQGKDPPAEKSLITYQVFDPDKQMDSAKGKISHKVNFQKIRKSKKKLPNRYELDDDSIDLVASKAPFTTSLSSKMPSSDSELSDTECNKVQNLKKINSQIRACSLETLYFFIKRLSQKQIFNYWAAFLPDCVFNRNVNSHYGKGLFTSLLKDPNPKCRMKAASVITCILESCKDCLYSAENDITVRTSFISFSVTLGRILKEIHNNLALALATESGSMALTQILKCCGVLMHYTPYHKLGYDLLQKLLLHLNFYLMSKDPTIVVVDLTALGSLISAHGHQNEVLELLINNPNNDLLSKGSVSISKPAFECARDTSGKTSQQPEKSWVVEVCLTKIDSIQKKPDGDQFDVLPVRVEAFQVLTELAHVNINLILPSVERLCSILMKSFQSHDYSLTLHALRLFESVGNCNSKSLSNDDNSPGSQGNETNSVTFLYTCWESLWKTFLSQHCQNLTSPEVPSYIRSAICDVFSTVGNHLLGNLPHDQNMYCITLVMGLANEEDLTIRAAAIRTLGIFVTYQSLSEDINFIMDCHDVIKKSINNSNTSLQVKSAWSLANLTDTLSLCREDVSDIPVHFFIDVLEVACEASLKYVKVRSNAVRAIGNILRGLPGNIMRGNVLLQPLLVKCIDSLVSNSTNCNNMKVRWNACHAIGNAMKNEALLDNYPFVQEQFMSALLPLIDSHKYLKVRINASVALASPCHRSHYAQIFVNVWKTMINGMENTQHIDDYYEFSHRDQLLDQLCLTFCHLVSIIQSSDVSAISSFTLQHYQVLDESFSQLHKRILPEKSSTLNKGMNNLYLLEKNIQVEEDIECIQILKALLQSSTD